VPVSEWLSTLTRKWDPKRDFALALLHAERLTRLLADEAICELLLEQASRHPERREVLERDLDRAEPRCRALHDEITTTGTRILASLASRKEGLSPFDHLEGGRFSNEPPNGKSLFPIAAAHREPLPLGAADTYE
jgi:hypothetical protein